MGNRLATTTTTTVIGQDHLVATWTNTVATTTLAADAVPASTSVGLVGPGDNTIAIPAKAAGVRIEPPVGSVNPKLIKGAAGDTGVVFGPANPITLFFPQTSMFTFVINSQVNETITLVWL
jgi:hypothetical protein